MRPVGDPVTLTRHWWDGPEPEAGDGLETASGRRYLILAVKGKRLDCMVLPKGEPIKGTVFIWEWTNRSTSRTQFP